LARQSLLQSLANLLLRQAITETRNAFRGTTPEQSRGHRKSKSSPAKSIGMTQYLVTGETVPMGHGGMRSYPVVGESFYSDHFEKLYELFQGSDEVFTTAYLVPDYYNPVDKNAVAVVVDKYVVGHIPRHAAKLYSDFLGSAIGECAARVYIDLHSGRNSVELDLDFPPRDTSSTTSAFAQTPFVGSDEPAFEMTQVSTRNSNIGFVSLEKGEAHEGIAIVRAGFRDEPEIVDSENLTYLGSPYQAISWDFNVFARSYGGEFRVRYLLELNDRGNLKLILDSSGLPKFKRSRY